MRTVSFGMNISLDGYCDHTTFTPREELYDYFTEMMQDVDLIFFGRVMYQLMFPYWSDVARDQSGTADENRFAERLTALEKVVVSRTLENAQHHTRIVRSNPVAELMKLKQQPGGTISVDTVSMLPELISAGLIDKFNLVVHPVIVGRGRPLIDAGSLQENFNLKLVDSIVFKSGCVALHYEKQ
ncbi:Dihydrofolate reductase [Chitinophaga eiseniae]|uniref:Dihydrofolate reductase n=1 Tax=Chitinophaga eiseniae TaxID=634771 RepID=A0A1T4R0A7_9BACT|nr:dihydrofolate reductase family protein [Chitinophaga eiseniae]SKA09316.1 Dihydrofolate reductase [Chitinophaga eiseniae]